MNLFDFNGRFAISIGVGIVLFFALADTALAGTLMTIVRTAPPWAPYVLCAGLVITGIPLWRSDEWYWNMLGLALFVLAGFLMYGFDFYLRRLPDNLPR